MIVIPKDIPFLEFYESASEGLPPASPSDPSAPAYSPDFSDTSFRSYFSSMMRDIRKYTIWMAVLFAVSILFGYIFGFYVPSFFETLSAFFQFPELSSFDLMLTIFVQNTKVAAMLIFLGFIFAALPILVVFFNGFTIGIVSEVVIREEGFLYLLIGLLPHGIIELPLIFISAGLGFKMGVGTLQVIFQRKSVSSFLFDFLAATLLFLIVIVPLLFVAAVIESYVTGFLLEWLF